MTYGVRSTAQPVSALFARCSPENKSVHFSFNGAKSKINLRIPANQLSGLINNLVTVKDKMEQNGDDVGSDNDFIIPCHPHDWFK
jgi:hypothetical protein